MCITRHDTLSKHPFLIGLREHGSVSNSGHKEVECFLVDKKGSTEEKIPKNLINVVGKEEAKIKENFKAKLKISNYWYAGLKFFPQVSIQWTSSTTNFFHVLKNPDNFGSCL